MLLNVQDMLLLKTRLMSSLINDLIADCYRINPHFHVAGIGRLNDQQIDKTVRKDKTFWFDSSSQAQITYLATMEAIKTQLNRELFFRLI